MLRIAAPLPAVLLAGLLTACAAPADDPAPGPAAGQAPPGASDAPDPRPRPEPEPEPEPGTVPPPWLGTRVLPLAANGFGEVRPTPPALRERRFTLPSSVPPLPGRGFASDVVAPPPARVLARSTWRPGCPIAAEALAWVRVVHAGFGGERVTGELLVDAAVADDVVAVFADLWRARFPLEELRITRADELAAPPTGDGNTSGSFVCRPAVGSTTWSEHAYGRAVDLNPFQNPYSRPDPAGQVVLPELASAYLDRSRRLPGTITADGPVVRAFAAVGWTWGGTWRTASDLHHFSLTGR